MRTPTGALLLGTLLLGTVPSYSRTGEEATGSALDLQLFNAPLRLTNASLPRALGMIGANVRGGYVQFGVELWLTNREEPSVNAVVPAGATVRKALSVALHGLPGYQYQVVSPHLIDIYPSTAKHSPHDLLNLRVARFDVLDQQAGDVLSRPQDFISVLRLALEPPSRRGQPVGATGSTLSDVGPPPIALHVTNVTVRQILNEVSQATESRPARYAPLGWLCEFEPDPKSPAGGKYRWQALSSAPNDWQQRTLAKPGRNSPN